MHSARTHPYASTFFNLEIPASFPVQVTNETSTNVLPLFGTTQPRDRQMPARATFTVRPVEAPAQIAAFVLRDNCFRDCPTQQSLPQREALIDVCGRTQHPACFDHAYDSPFGPSRSALNYPATHLCGIEATVGAITFVHRPVLGLRDPHPTTLNKCSRAQSVNQSHKVKGRLP